MKEMFRRRRLPHWDRPGATYFVTTCLAGSIPAAGLLEITRFRASLAKQPRPGQVSLQDWKLTCWKRIFALCDEWLDQHPAVCHLADPALAKIVADTLYFFAGERYDIVAYVVMPSHIHWVFTPLRDWAEKLPPGRSPRESIMQSLKRAAALKCNRHLEQTGAFWQSESYDHCVVDEEELERIVDYVELNPVKAGLVKSRELWPFSSAHDRVKLNIPTGPLVRP